MVLGIPTTEHLRPRLWTSWNHVSKVLSHTMHLASDKQFPEWSACLYYLINYRGTFLSTITSNNINLVNTTVLKTIDNFGSVMPSSWSSKDSPASLVDVVHRFRCQWNSIFRIKPLVSTLHITHIISTEKKWNKTDPNVDKYYFHTILNKNIMGSDNRLQSIIETLANPTK